MNLTDYQQRLAVARASEHFRRGRMSRRQFLHLCAQAGFGFSSLYLLGGCRSNPAVALTEAQISDTTGPESASVPGTEQQRFLKEVAGAFAGATLRIVGEDTPPTQATIEIMRQEFIPLTGIKVEWEQLPLDRVLAKVAADTANQTGAHDIFYWDGGWLGRFANDAVDLRQLLVKSDLAYPSYNFDDFLPPLVEGTASYQGRLVGIPFDIPIVIMIYRKDIFEELGLSLPRTIPDYLSVVQAIQQEKQPETYGTTGMWKSGHYSLVVDTCSWLWGHGGSFFGREERPAINDEHAAAAMEFMLELSRYMPPEVTTWDWGGEALSFAQGRAGLALIHSEYFPTFDDPNRSKIIGLAEAAPCPAEIALRTKAQCSFDETPGFSRQGGSCLSISKYSKNVDAAWIFLQWATSADVTTRANLLGGGGSPVRQGNFNDPRIKAKATVGAGTTRHFDITLDAILNRMGTEPHLPAWSTLAVDSFAVELGKMTTGQQNIKTSLDTMAKAALEAITQN